MARRASAIGRNHDHEGRLVEAAREVALCGRLFDELRLLSLDPPGVSRASYGEGERAAHGLALRTALDLGCETRTDFAGNLYMTRPGTDAAAAAVMIGSHLDAVPHGGNFDGAAGVVAGLGVLARLARIGAPLRRDVTVMAIRAEEMSWFPTHYIGSRAAFGLLGPAEVDGVVRRDTGRSLGLHMAEEGFEPDRVRAGERALDPAAIHCYVELHIEQGPILVDEQIPVGIVSGIRGNVRHRHGLVRGSYAHAGAVPRRSRRDAVLAAAAFARELEAMWLDLERQGRDFVATMGQFSTDQEQHTITKIPGELRFTIDMRSEDEVVLTEAERRLAGAARAIAKARGVSIELGPGTRAPAALMDEALRSRLVRLAAREEIAVRTMRSGGGHDCAVFVGRGIPSAMIFVRNDHGSHNPDEAMDMDDFAEAMRLLMAFVDEVASS